MISKDLVAASSTPLILSILSLGESYGYAIIRAVRDLSDEELSWTDGMLYPVLHRLENQRHIHSVWKKGENGRKRKYYSISDTGLAELERLKGQWTTVQGTLQKIWAKLEEKT